MGVKKESYQKQYIAGGKICQSIMSNIDNATSEKTGKAEYALLN